MPLLLAPAIARAAPADAAHAEEVVAGVLLALAIVLFAARAGGELAVRLGQPAVLGELGAGIVLGNLPLVGIHTLDFIGSDPTIQVLSQLGVLLLLFEVGLEATVTEMQEVGLSAVLVAFLGVAAPFAFGWGVGGWFLPGDGALSHAFLGAALTATSIGITARVLKDLGLSRGREAGIILGAAVLDDVLGLVILAVVIGAANAIDTGSTLSVGRVLLVVGKACGFLVAALLVGVAVARRAVRASAHLMAPGALLAVGLGWCFALAWLAHLVGLAPIVGAFAAGLVLEPDLYTRFTARGERGLEEQVHPLSSFLVPVFFVTTGTHTDLADFADAPTVLLALVLTIAAIAGKLASSLGARVRGARVDRLSIGIGMIPRGEVGLIFANIGVTLTVHGQPLLSTSTFSALVIMVMVTTLVTPPLLKKSLRRSAAARS